MGIKKFINKHESALWFLVYGIITTLLYAVLVAMEMEEWVQVIVALYAIITGTVILSALILNCMTIINWGKK